mgnify:CR=1 FL=1
MKINFMKTHPDAVIPSRGSAGAAGFDLVAVSLKRAADLYIYDIGIAMEIPAGYFAAIFPRSSIFFTGLELTNCVGVIDSDYRGEILVGLQNSGDADYVIQPADRIAQLMVVPVVQAQVKMVDQLDETQRGAGGFFSTGK